MGTRKPVADDTTVELLQDDVALFQGTGNQVATWMWWDENESMEHNGTQGPTWNIKRPHRWQNRFPKLCILDLIDVQVTFARLEPHRCETNLVIHVRIFDRRQKFPEMQAIVL